MKEIKYQLLDTSEDDDIDITHLDESENIYYSNENKKYWFIKIILILFIIIELIYIIYNFDKIINLLKNRKQYYNLTENYEVNIGNYDNYDGITNWQPNTEKYEDIKPSIMVSPLKIPFVKPYSTENEEKYFINTTHCHMTFVDPFSPEIQSMFKPIHTTGCTTDQPIITVSFNDTMGQYMLHINHRVAENLRNNNSAHAKPIEEDLFCCYEEVIRSGELENADKKYKLLPCTHFHQNFVVPLHINGIIVSCNSTTNNVTLQKDAFSFVQINKTLIDEEFRDNKNGRRKPSILMIGIDSLSRINFRRTMPKMFKYLFDNNWYELRGYNKVGDNTLPNLMALLTGYNLQTVFAKCKTKNIGGYDTCNFIWKKFKQNGYHTAYAEDSSGISTFNYLSRGFKEPPTDHYFRPMSMAFENSLNHSRLYGTPYCAGRRQVGEYIYDNAMHFATRYKYLPSFGFYWTNSFSHGSYHMPSSMDQKMLEYFKEWEKRGVFDETVVIFLSDHGSRWGPLLHLSSAYLETSLPMFFISLPKWFHQQYPELVKNLEINQRRLTNPFDIHMTLQHLIQLGDPNYEIQQALDCPKCQSIFNEIPEKRSCDDASIPETWCTCTPYKSELTASDVIIYIAQKIVMELNKYYENKNLTSICSQLKLSKIIDAKQRLHDDMTEFDNILIYTISFITLPKTDTKTQFSATVEYNVENKSVHFNVEDISRQSLYENTSKCTNDTQAKKYCICKNSLN